MRVFLSWSTPPRWGRGSGLPVRAPWGAGRLSKAGSGSTCGAQGGWTLGSWARLQQSHGQSSSQPSVWSSATVLIHVSYFPGEYLNLEAAECLEMWLFYDVIVSPCAGSLVSVATETWSQFFDISQSWAWGLTWVRLEGWVCSPSLPLSHQQTGLSWLWHQSWFLSIYPFP